MNKRHEPSLEERLFERRKRVEEKRKALSGAKAVGESLGASPQNAAVASPHSLQHGTVETAVYQPGQVSSTRASSEAPDSDSGQAASPGEKDIRGELDRVITPSADLTGATRTVKDEGRGDNAMPPAEMENTTKHGEEAVEGSNNEEEALNAITEDGEDVGHAAIQEYGAGAEQRAAEARVAMSRHAAAIARAEAEARVTDMFLQISSEERERRSKEEVLAKQRKERIAQETDQSEQIQGTIALRHQQLYAICVPHELKAALETQKAACDQVIAAKNELVATLVQEAKEKDEAYVNVLTKHAMDLDRMMQEMRRQANELRSAQANQLEEAEATYVKDRRELLDECAKGLFQLVKQRRLRENEYRKGREAQLAAAQSRLEEQHNTNYEVYNAHKLSGQSEMHALVQELEKCKADFLLNAERLDYNLQVLRERVKENKMAQNQYKRKLGRMQDLLSTLVARYSESEKRYQKVNRDLTEHLRRVTRQYRETQEKFQFFEKGDMEKYQRIWKMHEIVAWSCSTTASWATVSSMKKFSMLRGALPSGAVEMSMLLEANRLKSEDDEDSCASLDEHGGEEGGKIRLDENEAAILRILYQQAPFLVEEKVRAVISLLNDSGQADFVTLDAVLSALGIEKSEEVQKLAEYFLVEAEDGNEALALIHPQEAVRALTAYIQDRQEKQLTETKEAANEHGGNATRRVKDVNGTSMGVEGTTGATSSGLCGTASRCSPKAIMNTKHVRQEMRDRKQRQREAEHWEKLANIVPKAHLRTWDAVEKGLHKYLGQLQQRERLLEETERIRRENMSMRSLLAQYLGSDINRELYYSPQLHVNKEENTVSVKSMIRR